MPHAGVLYAITEETVAALLAASTDAELLSVVGTLEEEADEGQRADIDKAWDAIHRTLTDGSLNMSEGAEPLANAILGGKQLYRGDDDIVSLVLAEQVPEVARALARLDEGTFHQRYARLEQSDYAPVYGKKDARIAWEYFASVVLLYEHAAASGRAVMFTIYR
jgi:hypothetical protein